MKIAVLTQTPFPHGLASSNRIYYFAKGFIENGAESKIFVLCPTERPGRVLNTESEGVFKGVPFEYSRGINVRSSSFIRRRIDDIYGPVKTAFHIIRNNYDSALLIGFHYFYIITILKIIFMFSNVKFISEKTELPFHNKKQRGIHKIKNKILELFVFKSLYAFFTISYELQKHYKKLVSKNCPVVLMPVLVDEAEIYKKEVQRTNDLVYTGPLVQSKDGILTMIEAFDLIAEDFPGTDLILTGNIDGSCDKEKIYELVEKSAFKDRIRLTGFISRDDMIFYLNSAAGLLLAKPSGAQADTCFPTKIGEYLSTGNPVVVTRTGEIPMYLKDGYNAYISEPDSAALFAEKLKELLSDTEKSKNIGNKGREIVKELFDYKNNTMKIIELINTGEIKEN